MWVLLAAWVILGTGAWGATVQVLALKDAMILGTSAGADSGSASGNGPGLFVGADGSSARKRSLIAFDVASAGIPSNATIDSVTMTLYLGQVGGAGGPNGGGSLPSRTLRVYSLLQGWTEGSSGLATPTVIGGTGGGYLRRTGDATWDYASFDSGNSAAGKWNAGAGDLHGGNTSAGESGNSNFTSFSTLNAPFTWSSPQMAADVQAWINGSAANNGWLLQSDLEGTATSFLAFWSKDGAAANNNNALRPTLDITYSVPEPAGLCLAMLGLTAMLGRRRQVRRK